MTDLRTLAEQVVATQDEWLDELNPAPEARRRLLSLLHRPQRHAWRWAALGVAAAAVFAVVAWRMRAQSLTYTAGTSRTAAAVGAWLAAPPDTELPLRFSDQTTVILAAASHARVVQLQPREARLLLERGRVSVSVIHHDGRSWHLRAGPFDVAVTGTRFDVSWKPEHEQFEVRTFEGKVEVTAEQFAPRTVAAGETLRAERLQGQWRFVETDVPWRASAEPSGVVEGAASQPGPSGSVTDQAAAEAAASHASSSDEGTAPSASVRREVAPAPGWRELAAAGQYRAALEQAELDGFEGLCQKSSLPDLLALSEAARFAGRIDRARLALTSLRDRFRGEPAASVATFTLGRLAFDYSHDYLGAARWFRAYLGEQPQGSLAREAAGRLVESLERGGDHAGAQTAARGYLARYPDGPQSRLARQILGEIRR